MRIVRAILGHPSRSELRRGSDCRSEVGSEYTERVCRHNQNLYGKPEIYHKDIYPQGTHKKWRETAGFTASIAPRVDRPWVIFRGTFTERLSPHGNRSVP